VITRRSALSRWAPPTIPPRSSPHTRRPQAGPTV
jgi:hypothetical protein